MKLLFHRVTDQIKLLATFILVLALLQLSAHAVTGSKACIMITRQLITQGISVYCEYKPLKSSKSYMYYIELDNTVQIPDVTIGLTIASIVGFDRKVPTKSAGIGFRIGSSLAVWEMPDVRNCAKWYLHDDKAFVSCLSNLAQTN